MLKIKPYGFITASDSGYFTGFAVLVLSINNRAPITLMDYGITDKQKEWCLSHNVRLTVPELPMGREMFNWQTWNKPWLILQSPYKYTVWIDSDCIVGKESVEPLFDMVRNRPWAIRHWKPKKNFRDQWWTGSKWACGNLHILSTKYMATNLPETDYVNAGVIGFNPSRDRSFLNSWMWMCEQAKTDQFVIDNCPFYDEGALNWTIRKHDDPKFILDNRTWNNHIPDLTQKLLNRQNKTPSDFIQNAWTRGCLKKNLIVHLCGVDKYWTNLDTTDETFPVDIAVKFPPRPATDTSPS